MESLLPVCASSANLSSATHSNDRCVTRGIAATVSIRQSPSSGAELPRSRARTPTAWRPPERDRSGEDFLWIFRCEFCDSRRRSSAAVPTGREFTIFSECAISTTPESCADVRSASSPLVASSHDSKPRSLPLRSRYLISMTSPLHAQALYDARCRVLTTVSLGDARLLDRLPCPETCRSAAVLACSPLSSFRRHHRPARYRMRRPSRGR